MRLLLGVLSITIIFAYASCKIETLPTGCFDAFYQAALTRANKLRISHNSPALTTDEKLNSSSLIYANKMVDFPLSLSNVADNVNILKETKNALTVANCERNIYFLN
jgi:hypothetical protein